MDVFEDLYNTTLVEEEGCWIDCNGGFCCSNNHPDFKFICMTTNGTDIVYLPREYDWAQKNRRTFNNQTGVLPHVIEFDVGEFSIGVVYTRCQLLGKCDGVIDKPFLCRLYPFLPVFTYEGDFEEVIPASVFDLTFEAAGLSSCCALFNKKRSDFSELFAKKGISECMDTYVKFYLRSAYHFSALMSEGIRNDKKLSEKKGQEFWRCWEMLHLRGLLIDVGKFKELILAEYAAAKKFDPEFCMLNERSLLAKIRTNTI